MDESHDRASKTNGDEDLSVDYANNTAIEPTVWDLKILFGEYSGRSRTVEWHTSITIPWAQAKLLSYYLQANIAFREIGHGKIAIPLSMLPPAPPPLTSEQEQDPKNQAFFEWLREFHQRFIDSL